jgi:hypothetical protein
MISDIWPEASLVCFQVWNQGDASAPAGYLAALRVDGSARALLSVPQALAPGERWDGCFDHHWACADASDQVEVEVDPTYLILESNESNNIRAESWQCDTTHPAIISGPTVSNITLNAARISWQTDEASTSRVDYGRMAGYYSDIAISAGMATSHVVELSGLQAFTTYHYRVDSRDAFGNAVQSSDLAFHTMPALDLIDPVILFDPPATITATVTMTSTVTDEGGVSRVVYFVDGLRAFTDYSSPYRFVLDSTALANGAHTIEARAYDLAGNSSSASRPASVANLKDLTLPTVDITAPLNGATVAGKVNVTATLTDDSGIVSARFYMDGDYQQYEPYDVSNPPKNATVTFEWDSRAYANNSQHRLAVEVYDTSGNLATDFVDISVYNAPPTPPPSPPWLEVTGHYAIRNQNKLLVFLNIYNSGDAEARNVEIQDLMKGFQPIGRETTDAVFTTEWNPVGKFGYAVIHPKTSIPAKEARTYAFYVVPVLVSPSPPQAEIGFFVNLAWDQASGPRLFNNDPLPIAKTIDGVSIAQSHADAVKISDYLIVTNPYRLFAIFNPGYYQGASKEREEANALLSSMAELAYYKQGILGYNYDNSAQALHSLIQPGGTWNKALFGGYSTFGYLLLVGENNVVPGWYRYYGSRETTLGDLDFFAPYTDYPYANMFGDEIYPELSIARIIGDNPGLMEISIRTAINLAKGETGYHYDGLLKFLVSGYPATIGGNNPSVIDFKGEVNKVVKKLTGSVVVMDTPGLSIYKPDGTIDIPASTAAIQTAFFNNTPSQDIIFLAAHGNWNSWDVITTTKVINQTNPFANTNPFVFASACSTAEYAGARSFGEGFLYKKAAAYMGAIRFGMCYGDQTCPNADKYFANWNTSKSFARALRDTKASLGDDIQDRYWTGIYHVFGDAKFGSVGSAQQAEASPSANPQGPRAPVATVEVHVPALSVEEQDGVHRITIPGEETTYEEGKPQTPVYMAFLDYPAGTQIQGVRLEGRSEPQRLTDLNIPPAQIAIPGLDASIALADSAPNPEWWPEKVFKWHVVENPSTTTLALTIYPFYYNALTHEGLFYQDYTFEIESTESAVEVTRIATEADILSLGDTANIEVELENHATQGVNVMVRALMEASASGEVVDGLLLTTLADLQGKASFALQWPSAGIPAGDYAVHVELLDAQGNLVDQAYRTLQVGIRQAELSGLAIDPAIVLPGEPVQVSFSLHNSGELPISGTLALHWRNASGEDVEVYTETVAALQPDAYLPVSHTLQTDGLPWGNYSLVTYFMYNGQASNVLAGPLEIIAPARLYLPLTER